MQARTDLLRTTTPRSGRTRTGPTRRRPHAAVAVLAALAALTLGGCASTPEGQGPTGPTGSATAAPTSSATPSGDPTDGATAEPPTLGEADLAGLFLDPATIAATVPAAAGGVEQVVGPGELPWGLPEGSSVEPAACTVARTVVAEPPVAFDARVWSGDGVDVEQTVAVLADRAGAEAAFDELVAAVEACPEYVQVNPETDGGSWTAGPPTPVAAPFRAVWLERTHAAEGAVAPALHGHVLVSNAIVTWTVTVFGDGVPPTDGLGTGPDLDAMVQQRALEATGGTGVG